MLLVRYLMKDVSNGQQGYIYFVKNTVKQFIILIFFKVQLIPVMTKLNFQKPLL